MTTPQLRSYLVNARKYADPKGYVYLIQNHNRRSLKNFIPVDIRDDLIGIVLSGIDLIRPIHKDSEAGTLPPILIIQEDICPLAPGEDWYRITIFDFDYNVQKWSSIDTSFALTLEDLTEKRDEIIRDFLRQALRIDDNTLYAFGAQTTLVYTKTDDPNQEVITKSIGLGYLTNKETAEYAINRSDYYSKGTVVFAGNMIWEQDLPVELMGRLRIVTDEQKIHKLNPIEYDRNNTMFVGLEIKDTDKGRTWEIIRFFPIAEFPVVDDSSAPGIKTKVCHSWDHVKDYLFRLLYNFAKHVEGEEGFEP